MPDMQFINGNAVSWNSLYVSMFLPNNTGGRIYGIHSVDISGEKRERPPVYGQNRAARPMGLPEGKYTPPMLKLGFLAHTLEADETAHYDSVITLLKAAAIDGRSYGSVPIYWLIQVAAPNVARMQYELFGCYLTEPGGSWEETAEGLKREAVFQTTYAKTNGGTLYDSSEEFG
jgi:hypothetical protein